MGKHYHHLTEQDRIFLGIMIRKGYTQQKIADILGVHRTTIYREIKHNSSTTGFKKKQEYIGSF